MVPKESSWFGSLAPPEDDDLSWMVEQDPSQWAIAPPVKVIPMREQPLYTEDWIGLKSLDELGAVVFEVCEGEHMQISNCWQRIVEQFTGGPE